MINCKCIEKFRDKNNKIIGYRLQDSFEKTVDFNPLDLKNAIINKQIKVTNLTLTSDNRLIDKEEKLVDNKLRNTIYVIIPSNININNITIIGTKDIDEIKNKALTAGRNFESIGSKSLVFYTAKNTTLTIETKYENCKFVSVCISNTEKIKELIDNNAIIELLYHPLNIIKNKLEDIDTDEIITRFESVRYNYLDACSDSDYFEADVDECEIFDSLVKYNWKIFKSFIPIFKTIKAKIPQNISESDIIHSILKNNLAKFKIDDEDNTKYHTILIKQDNNSDANRYTEVHKIAKINLNNVKLTPNDMRPYSILKSMLNLVQLGASEDTIADLYNFEPSRDLEIKMGLDTSYYCTSKWLYIESLINSDGSLNLDDFNKSICDKDSDRLGRLEDLLICILRNENKYDNYLKPIEILKSLKIIHEYNKTNPSIIGDYFSQIDNNFINSIYIMSGVIEHELEILGAFSVEKAPKTDGGILDLLKYKASTMWDTIKNSDYFRLTYVDRVEYLIKYIDEKFSVAYPSKIITRCTLNTKNLYQGYKTGITLGASGIYLFIHVVDNKMIFEILKLDRYDKINVLWKSKYLDKSNIKEQTDLAVEKFIETVFI